MPFVTVPGLKGKVYVPEKRKCPKKHPCKDCFSCEFCSDDRCGVCRKNMDPGEINSGRDQSGKKKNSS